MIHIDLPYDYGTFVKVKNENGMLDYCGTVVAYTITDDGWTVWVSGYKESITGEFLPDEIELMSEDDIKELKERYA